MIGGLLICGLLVGATPASEPAPAVYVLIVANNASLNDSREPLRFADDDGARYAELFGIFAEEVRLYSVFDADTQRTFPQQTLRAIPPRRDAILAGLEELFAAMRQQTASGRKVVFYFIFSGHGEVGDDGEGYVHLLDEPWTRTDLFTHVIAASPATINHVVIDACNSYYMVARRGSQAVPAGNYGNLIRDFVGRERLERYPNTGVILSTANAAEVHEWGRIEAGIFSHELRSALAGAADANGDGAIDYDEVAAYIAAANGALPDQKTRLQVYARAPAQNLREPLLRLSGNDDGPRVTVPASWSGHYHLEDDRGVRFVDFNKTAEIPITLRLVPRSRYYLRGNDREYLIEPVGRGFWTTGTALEARPLLLAARGASHDAFDQHLFAIPFGPSFVEGYKYAVLFAPKSLPPMVVKEERPLRPWIYTSAIMATALAVTSGVLAVLAQTAAAEYRNAAGDAGEISARRGRAQDFQTAAIVTGSASLTSVAAAVGLYWIER